LDAQTFGASWVGGEPTAQVSMEMVIMLHNVMPSVAAFGVNRRNMSHVFNLAKALDKIVWRSEVGHF
jgi:hypothetical protein